MFRAYLVPINRAGWPFIAIFAAATVLAALFVGQWLTWILFLLTVWCCYFFRDPERVVPTRDGLVISPADGLVQSVGRVEPPVELGLPPDRHYTRISVFMDVFDVHVNRSPVDGRVISCRYTPGKFLNAALDKASVENERQAISMETADGLPIGVVQIAGLVARRILCHATPGETLRRGQRFGLIRFGSRVDVFVPEGTAIVAIPGQHAYAGETVLADLISTEGSRAGEWR